MENQTKAKRIQVLPFLRPHPNCSVFLGIPKAIKSTNRRIAELDRIAEIVLGVAPPIPLSFRPSCIEQ